MKRLVYVAVACLLLAACNQPKETTDTPVRTSTAVVADNGVIRLVAPDMNVDGSVMNCLQMRESVREYAERDLDIETLSDLLWAANGINRPESGKRTAPSAVNAQDIMLYVCRADGAYLYVPEANELRQVTTVDLRPAVAASQAFAATVPVSLLIVSDLARFPFEDKERAIRLGALDAGYVSQNIYLYCTAAGLGTVARGTMDVQALTEALGLTEMQIPMLNHPVGYKVVKE